MKQGKYFGKAGVAVLVLLLGLVAGCKNQQPAPAARPDQQMASDIQAKLHAESALAGQNIQVDVANGVVTLSGNVADPDLRALAASDCATINGIKTVVNDLTVEPAPSALVPVPQAAPPRTASAPPPARQREKKTAPPQEQAVAAAPPVVQPVVQPAVQAPPSPPPAPLPPPEPPKPVVRQVILPSGTVIPIRISERLDSKTAQPNDVFHGEVASDVEEMGVVAIPRESSVMGRVVDAKDAAHFKGSSLLSIELTQVIVRGQKVSLVTDSYTKSGEGRGKNTVEKAGGGALFGALVGALAGGGKGAAIGTLAGGAAGTGVNAATRGQQVDIPSESLINFQLQSDLTLRVTIPPNGQQVDQSQEPQLLRH